MLAAGTRIGVYEVISALGAGGMGQVYRARDTRLGRDVALKVLPPQFSSDPSRLARFQREARQIAALNHPNIVGIFDTGRDGEIAYIATELVDGTTLRGSRLPVRKVAEVGAQIADALAAAHRAGVIHRDIKPDNVMVTREGRVKLLDFGVAKVTGPLDPDSATMSQTVDGSIVGTVGYMAPEQVRADHVDQRTDIFALGILLFELLADTPPFRGDTTPEIMAATLRTDPGELPAGIPDSFQRIVRRCLEKNPDERFQSADDLAFALRQLAGSSSGKLADAGLSAPPTVSHVPRSPSRLWFGASGFALGLIVAAVAISQWLAEEDAAVDQVRLTRITADRRSEIGPEISPDGRSLAYLRVASGVYELLVRPLESDDAVTVARSDTVLSSVIWSADGNQVCYRDGRALWCVGAAGGAPRRILEDVTWPQMDPNGRDFFFVRVIEQQPWLYRGSLTGGEPQRVGSIGGPMNLDLLSPVSPDGRSIILAARSQRWLVSLPNGERHALPAEESRRTRSIAWLPDSRHFVAVEETRTLIGSRIIVHDTRSAARHLIVNTADFIDSIATTPDGSGVVYAGGPVERDIAEYSENGTFIRTVAGSSMLEGFPAWARTGDRFAYRAGGPGQTDTLWMATLDGAAPRLIQHLTSNAASQTPFSPDGGRIAYTDGTGIHVVSVSGGRAVQVLATTKVGATLCWTPDGDWIWYSEGPARLGRVPSAGGEPQFVQITPGPLVACSPDGRSFLRLGARDYVITSSDGKSDRMLARTSEYATRGDGVGQFSGDGTRVYLLRQERRTIDVWDVQKGEKLKPITFDTPVEDQIEGFSVSPDGTRVLLTTGGDRTDLWMARGFVPPTSGWKRFFTHWDVSRASER